jgi:hypothetical protein
MYPSKLFAKPLDLSDQERLIQAFKESLLALPGLKNLYLVGSASRLEMTDGSDLDFVAVFSSEVEIALAKARFYNFPRPVDWPCDVLWYTEVEFNRRSKLGGICFIALSEGVRLL